jgi:hypothetical protein
MARKTSVAGVKVRRGKNLATGKGWRLVRPSGKRALKASLITTLHVGGGKLAVFRVLPRLLSKARLRKDARKALQNLRFTNRQSIEHARPLDGAP